MDQLFNANTFKSGSIERANQHEAVNAHSEKNRHILDDVEVLHDFDDSPTALEQYKIEH